MLRSFRAFQLAKEFHWVCKGLRVSRVLEEQLLRASSSVALNLAEGSAKRTPAEQRRFYGIALGSLRESSAILELERIIHPRALQLADELGAILHTLSHPRKSPTETTNSPLKPKPPTELLTQTETDPPPPPI